jgi:hypothetical protein
MVWLEVEIVSEVNTSEIVLKLKVKPGVSGHGWSALVEGAEPESQIRFQDLQTLLRYLQALSDHRPIKGLR